MPRIGITLGDPSGIGPEIVAKALVELDPDGAEFTIFGNRDNFLHTAESANIPKEKFREFEIVDIAGAGMEYGKVSASSGRVARESIEEAVDWAMNGRIDGMCTAPVNKEALIAGGSIYKDHTEMLAGLTGSSDTVTVFEVRGLRIIFLSKHVSLREACDMVSRDSVLRYIRLADLSLSYLGINGRKIAVAALNPHGGEGGMFGREEIDEIIPAVAKAREKYDVIGPIPADSVFAQAAEGKYDIVLSMYHDQGHIAAKTLDFGRTVSMNLGLPFLRTSVDHGTAFDIAGRGVADSTSMKEALLKCIRYAGEYRSNFLKIRD